MGTSADHGVGPHAGKIVRASRKLETLTTVVKAILSPNDSTRWKPSCGPLKRMMPLLRLCVLTRRLSLGRVDVSEHVSVL